MVWGSSLRMNGDKHCACLRGLCDSMKVNAQTWCKWVMFYSDALYVSKREISRSEKGKERVLKRAVLKRKERISSNSSFNHRLEKLLLYCCD